MSTCYDCGQDDCGCGPARMAELRAGLHERDLLADMPDGDLVDEVLNLIDRGYAGLATQIQLVAGLRQELAEARAVCPAAPGTTGYVHISTVDLDQMRLQAGSGEVEIDQLRADVEHLRAERDAALFDRDEERVNAEGARRMLRRVLAEETRFRPVVEATGAYVAARESWLAASREAGLYTAEPVTRQLTAEEQALVDAYRSSTPEPEKP